MKRSFFFILLLSSLAALGQTPISQLPPYSGNPNGGQVPILIGGTTRRVDATLFGYNKVDSVIIRNDSLFYFRRGVRTYGGRATTGGGPASLNLQQVLTNGNVSTLGMTVDHLATPDGIQLRSDGAIIGPNQIIMQRGPYGGYLNAPATLTGNRFYNFPDRTGNVAFSVNGVMADATGNITIPTSSNNFLNGLTLSGNNAKLGGVLTENTVVSGRDYNINFGTTGNRVNQFNVYARGGVTIYDTIVGGYAPSLMISGGSSTLQGNFATVYAASILTAQSANLLYATAPHVLLEGTSSFKLVGNGIQQAYDTSKKLLAIGSDGQLYRAWWPTGGGSITPGWATTFNSNVLSVDSSVLDNRYFRPNDTIMVVRYPLEFVVSTDPTKPDTLQLNPAFTGGGPGGAEVDPSFNASPAAGITSPMISNWNEAYNKYTVSGVYSSGTITFTRKDGTTWNVTGLSTGGGSETDPVWNADKSNYWTKTQSDSRYVLGPLANEYGLFLNGTIYGVDTAEIATRLRAIKSADSIWNTRIGNYYTKTNLQTSGQASVHSGNITNVPASWTENMANADLTITGSRYHTGNNTGGFGMYDLTYFDAIAGDLTSSNKISWVSVLPHETSLFSRVSNRSDLGEAVVQTKQGEAMLSASKLIEINRLIVDTTGIKGQIGNNSYLDIFGGLSEPYKRRTNLYVDRENIDLQAYRINSTTFARSHVGLGDVLMEVTGATSSNVKVDSTGISLSTNTANVKIDGLWKQTGASYKMLLIDTLTDKLYYDDIPSGGSGGPETDPVWTAAAGNYKTSTQLATSGQASVHWNNITNAPSFLTSETDPVWTAAINNYYTKTNLQTSGQAQVHADNVTNVPSSWTQHFGNTNLTFTGNRTHDANANSLTLQNVAGFDVMSPVTAAGGMAELYLDNTTGYFGSFDSSTNGYASTLDYSISSVNPFINLISKTPTASSSLKLSGNTVTLAATNRDLGNMTLDLIVKNLPVFSSGDDSMVVYNPVTDKIGYRAIPSGGSGGEANTASNLGGGLANWHDKNGVDLRFNTFDATDFDLASNLLSIDANLKSNWNTAASNAATAVGWGNHALAGYLTASALTPYQQNVYAKFNDGTNQADASAADNFRIRSANNLLSVLVTDNDATHGDNVLFTVNQANLQLTQSQVTGLTAALAGKVDGNAAITGATKTKITYDDKGLVTGGADATTTDIGEGTNLYFTNARARSAISATGNVSFNSSTGVISLSSNVVDKTAANAYSAGQKQSFSGNGTSAPINIGALSGNPSSLTGGDIWPVSNELRYADAGAAVRTLLTTDLAQTFTNKTLNLDNNTVNNLPFRAGFYSQSPTASEQIPLFQAGGSGATITSGGIYLRGTSPSVTYTIHYGSTYGTSAGTLRSSTTVNTTGYTAITFTGTSVPANNHVWLVTTAVSGTIDEFTPIIKYKE